MIKFSDKVNKFNKELKINNILPSGIELLNPFKESKQIQLVSKQFYTHYYGDTNKRYLILGINPGRLGAGTTGIPFTDVKRLKEKCGININIADTNEISSVFIYEMIEAYGGVEKFYKQFYISSVCPLGFIKKNEHTHTNYNYYDNAKLYSAVESFIIDCILKQLDFEVNRDICFCLGTGKNKKYLSELNQRENFFKKIIFLEHPRYIMQYKIKQKNAYIKKYIDAFESIKQKR